ncbi:hypothetical protein [Chamaesiphon minutus]|uniref:hypothetical protein n=1 Tax=Chamaesiphon minutus TaxID=1173032 RepID=UPI0002E2C07B|nr:hypothetical protein [Chamaesiphon minutus]
MNFRTNRFTLSSLPILTEKSYLRQAARAAQLSIVAASNTGTDRKDALCLTSGRVSSIDSDRYFCKHYRSQSRS